MKIRGNTVGTTLPKPNLDQTNPLKGDYVKGDRSKFKGDKGDKGDIGIGIVSVKQTTKSTADDGNNILTITLTDGTTATFTVQNGSKGSQGKQGNAGANGADGYSPTVSVTEIIGGHRVTITDKNGSQTFDVMDGEDGEGGGGGTVGKDGFGIYTIDTWVYNGTEGTIFDANKIAELESQYGRSLQIGDLIMTTSGNAAGKVFRVRSLDNFGGYGPGYPEADLVADIKGADGASGSPGKDGADGYTPQKGIDYYTDADKTEMVNAVIAALPVYDGEVVSV